MRKYQSEDNSNVMARHKADIEKKKKEESREAHYQSS